MTTETSSSAAIAQDPLSEGERVREELRRPVRVLERRVPAVDGERPRHRAVDRAPRRARLVRRRVLDRVDARLPEDDVAGLLVEAEPDAAGLGEPGDADPV